MYRDQVIHSINTGISVSVIPFLTLIAGLGLPVQTSQTQGHTAAEPQRCESVFPAMGVQFRIVLYMDRPDEFVRVRNRVRDRIHEIEKSLSDYDSDSEISRIARSAPHDSPVTISNDLRHVGRVSTRIHRLSGGAFDPTIGSVSVIWRMARKRNRLPSDFQIESAMTKVGWHHLNWHSDNKLRIDTAAVQLDFGGVAKGYAADQAIEICQANGIGRALVDAGGDIRVSAPPPGRAGWRIAVDCLPARHSALWNAGRLSITAHNRGIATSGDAKQNLTRNGQFYSHIIDPRTGRAIRNGCAVTVLASDAATADAFASALSVLGSRKGRDLAEKTAGVEALFVCPNEDRGPIWSCTSGFNQYLADSITDPAAGFRD